MTGPNSFLHYFILRKTVEMWEGYAKKQGFDKLYFEIVSPTNVFAGIGKIPEQIATFFEKILGYSIQREVIAEKNCIAVYKTVSKREILNAELCLATKECINNLRKKRPEIHLATEWNDRGILLKLASLSFEGEIECSTGSIKSSGKEYKLTSIEELEENIEQCIERFDKAKRLSSVFEKPRKIYDQYMDEHEIYEPVRSEMLKEVEKFYTWEETQNYFARELAENPILYMEILPGDKRIEKIKVLNHYILYDRKSSQFEIIKGEK
jgi:hypothetical protein